MSIYEEHSAFFKQPIHLKPHEQNNPLEVIADFFDDFELHEVRLYIQQLCMVALTTDNALFTESRDRKDIRFFCEQLEICLEANCLLVAKHST